MAKQTKIFTPEVIKQARQQTLSIIKDLIPGQRSIFRNKNEERNQGLIVGTNGMGVENLLGYIQYTAFADQFRREGQQYAAINLYDKATQAYENGVLDGYFNNLPALLKLMDRIESAMRHLAKGTDKNPNAPARIMHEDNDGQLVICNNPAVWSEFSVPKLYYAYSGKARSHQRLDNNALAVRDYYTAKEMIEILGQESSARIEEGLGDAFLANSRHRNDDLTSVITANPYINDNVLIAAGFKYANAEQILAEKGIVLDEARKILDALRGQETPFHVEDAQKLEAEIQTMQKIVSRLARIRSKKEQIEELL
ncbi:Uncharacterised protein [uncultured archaeon]|nr:Uncharacterised protein [uncultured archaeon]